MEALRDHIRTVVAQRIGCNEKIIQNNIRTLEKAGLVQRQPRRTAAGDWDSDIYDLSGLVAKVKAQEPEFTEERKQREALRAQIQRPGRLKAMPK